MALPGKNMQHDTELDKLWDAAKNAWVAALQASYNLCAEQQADNVYIPDWFVDISVVLVDAYKSGKLVKVEGEDDEQEQA